MTWPATWRPLAHARCAWWRQRQKDQRSELSVLYLFCADVFLLRKRTCVVSGVMCPGLELNSTHPRGICGLRRGWLASSLQYAGVRNQFRSRDQQVFSLCLIFSWTSRRFFVRSVILMLAISSLIALIEYFLELSIAPTGTLYTFVFISSSPPTFVMVTEMSFPFSPRQSAVCWRMRLTYAPESKRTLTRFWIFLGPKMFAVITGNIDSCLFDNNATPMITLLLLCNRGWWNEVHWIPFSDFVHCLFLLQFACLCSLPAFFRQLKQTWLASAAFTR